MTMMLSLASLPPHSLRTTILPLHKGGFPRPAALGGAYFNAFNYICLTYPIISRRASLHQIFGQRTRAGILEREDFLYDNNQKTMSFSRHEKGVGKTMRCAKPGSKSLFYGQSQIYVLIEPGQEEEFLAFDELHLRLKAWVEKYFGEKMPADLARFEKVDDAVNYLIASACELDIDGGIGSVQWFEVRIE